MKIDEKTFKAMPAELQALFSKCPNPGSDEVVGLFPQNAGAAAPASGKTYSGTYQGNCYGVYNGNKGAPAFHNDSGSAARFFYCAKASRSERNAGLEGMAKKFTATMNDGIGKREHNESEPNAWTQNHHPTVKPLALMRYLCRLVTPPGGIVLDPFAGSGSTGVACAEEGFGFIGIEREAEYCEIARARIENRGGLFYTSNPELRGGARQSDLVKQEEETHA